MVAGASEPRFIARSGFTGALLPVCGVDVLIVVVQPRILFDAHEANLYVTAFHLRFHRTIVLMAQDDATHVPTYYGPADLVRALSVLPFEMIPWQRMLYRFTRPRAWRLPIPPEPPPAESDADPLRSAHASRDTGRYDSSLEALVQTRIREPPAVPAANSAGSAAAASEDAGRRARQARTTAR